MVTKILHLSLLSKFGVRLVIANCRQYLYATFV